MSIKRRLTALAARSALKRQLSSATPELNAATNTDFGVMIPAAYGSLGDEALIQGVLGIIAARGLSAAAIAPDAAEPWTKLGITPVLSDVPFRTGGDLLWKDSVPQTTGLGGLAVIGADSIDGAYGVRGVTRKVSALNVFAKQGRPAHLINFSLRAVQDPLIVPILRSLHPDVTVTARDPLSQARAREVFQRPVGCEPDAALFLEPRETAATVEVREEITSRTSNGERRVAALIVNAHLAQLYSANIGDDSGYFATIAQRLIDAGYLVTIFAHDIRDNPGDAALVAEVAAALPSADVISYVAPTAREAKAVLAAMSLVVTARMHGAVGSLSSHVPTIGLDYVDKFVGQFSWYNQEQLVIPWAEAATGSKLGDLIAQATADRDAIVAELQAVTAKLRTQSGSWIGR